MSSPDRDTETDPVADEFLEIVNIGSETANLSGWTVSDGTGVRFTFPAGTAVAQRLAAQGGLVDTIEKVCRADKHTLEALHALQHFVDFGDFVATLRERAVLQEAVGFVEEQHGFFLLSFFEHCCHVLLGFTDVLAHQIARFLDDERTFDGLRDVLAKRGLSRAGQPEKA